MSPRPRQPRQERARATVDTLVEATGQVLGAEGWTRTTTARVADRAGVSVGSLYQYFPDKAALITTFVARRLQADVALVERVTAQAGGLTPVALLRVAIDELVATFRRDRDLYRSVAEMLPLLEQTREVREGLDAAHASAVALLEAQPDLCAGRDPGLVALVALHAVRGSLFRILELAPEKLDDHGLTTMLHGLVLGVLGLPLDAE